MWLEGCDHLVSSAGDPPGQQDVRPASRPLVGGDHPRRDGHQDPHVPGGLRDRRDLQDFPVSFFFFRFLFLWYLSTFFFIYVGGLVFVLRFSIFFLSTTFSLLNLVIYHVQRILVVTKIAIFSERPPINLALPVPGRVRESKARPEYDDLFLMFFFV